MPSFLFPNGTFFPDGSLAPQLNTPLAGATVAMAYPSLYLTPAGTLATLTVKLPARPFAGMTASILSTQAVTALTLQTASGGAVAGAPTALVANTNVAMRWTGTAWVWVH